jgi:hypothetical protein
MTTIARDLAQEIARRGYNTGVTYDAEVPVTICHVRSKTVITVAADLDGGRYETTNHDPVGIDVSDFGRDPSGNVDVRWMDADGQTQEYSVAPHSVDVSELADRVVGPEDVPPAEPIEFDELT